MTSKCGVPWNECPNPLGNCEFAGFPYMPITRPTVEKSREELVCEEWEKFTAAPGTIKIEIEPEGIIGRIGAWWDRMNLFVYESRVSFTIGAVIVALAALLFIAQWQEWGK